MIPTLSMESPRLLPPLGIQAPWPGAGGREVEPDEAVQHRGHATVHGRPEALRGVELEVRHRHFSSQEKGDRASEQTDEEEASAERLEDGAEAYLRHQPDGAAVRWNSRREREQLRRAGKDEHGRCDNPEHALQVRTPGGPL